MSGSAEPVISSLSFSPVHGFSKEPFERLTLIAGEGVAGDAHCGATVKHRSRVRLNPAQPNLRQVHLLAAELLDELTAFGFAIKPGDLGENVVTSGLDLLSLPRGALIVFPSGATIQLTGLRNPCSQIEAFQPGLLAQVVGKSAEGKIERRAGVMAIVISGGAITVGDRLSVILPEQPHLNLEVV